MNDAGDAHGMDAVFRALADPSRRSLLDSLNGRNGQTLGELCAGLAMTRQSVSKHLAVLEAADLVTTARRGREKLHHLNAAPINAIADRWINHYDRQRAQALADLKTALEQTVMSAPTTQARRPSSSTRPTSRPRRSSSGRRSSTRPSPPVLGRRADLGLDRRVQRSPGNSPASPWPIPTRSCSLSEPPRRLCLHLALDHAGIPRRRRRRRGRVGGHGRRAPVQRDL